MRPENQQSAFSTQHSATATADPSLRSGCQKATADPSSGVGVGMKAGYFASLPDGLKVAHVVCSAYLNSGLCF